jgi:hypothetical protein
MSFLSKDSQVGISKFPKLRLLQLWRFITFFIDLRLRWILRKSCNPRQKLFNNVWHATLTQGNQSNFRLLMIRSQIDNLIPNPFFDHNSCFKNPNGSCKPILDIYVPKFFQWYKELFNLMNFVSDFQIGNSFESVGVHSLTLSCAFRNMKCDSQACYWPVALQGLALVTNPRLKL